MHVRQPDQGGVTVGRAAAVTPPRLVHAAVAQRRTAPVARQIIRTAHRRLVPIPARQQRHHHRRAAVDQQRVAEFRCRAHEHFVDLHRVHQRRAASSHPPVSTTSHRASSPVAGCGGSASRPVGDLGGPITGRPVRRPLRCLRSARWYSDTPDCRNGAGPRAPCRAYCPGGMLSHRPRYSANAAPSLASTFTTPLLWSTWKCSSSDDSSWSNGNSSIFATVHPLEPPPG